MEDRLEGERFEAQFRTTIFAADPKLYDLVFEKEDQTTDVEWVVPKSDQEVAEIMDLIKDLEDVQ